MLRWSNSFSVGNTTIDEQHKELIAIINEVTRLISEEDFDYSNIVELIRRLEDYVKFHFDEEENLMLKYDYPQIEVHTNQHNQLRYKVFNTKIYDIDTPKEFYTEALIYLMDWLAKHIMQTDKQLANYIKTKEA
jgi:hemerythrin-like metal-binding domain